VTSARRLYERFRQIIHEGAKFGIIGIIGVLVNNAIYQVLVTHGIGQVTSSTVGFVVTAIMSYLGNRYWSFNKRERTTVHRETVLFFALNGVGLLIQDAAVGFNKFVLHNHGQLAGTIALNVGILLGTLFRFWSYRKWVWAEPEPAPAGHEAIEPELVATPPLGGPTRNAADRQQ
jgi:putative flippase GtrA